MFLHEIIIVIGIYNQSIQHASSTQSQYNLQMYSVIFILFSYLRCNTTARGSWHHQQLSSTHEISLKGRFYLVVRGQSYFFRDKKMNEHFCFILIFQLSILLKQ